VAVTGSGAAAGAQRPLPLLVVEEAYVHGDGIVLAPFLPGQPNRKVRVRYETPDGFGGVVNGHVEAAIGRVWAPGRLSPPHESAIIVDAPRFRVPAGTRIWIVEDERSEAPPTIA
jgi:hypothetical protein